MFFIPKVKTREREDGTHDLEIDHGHIKIYLLEKYPFLQLVGDVLVGTFFVTGSILNVTGSSEMYGSLAYLVGSLSLTIRPTLKVIRRTWIQKT